MVKDTMFIFRMTLGSFVDAPTRRIVSCTIRMLSLISLSRTKRIWERAISFGRKWVIWVINNLVIILFEKLHKCQYSDKGWHSLRDEDDHCGGKALGNEVVMKEILCSILGVHGYNVPTVWKKKVEYPSGPDILSREMLKTVEWIFSDEGRSQVDKKFKSCSWKIARSMSPT